jgi:prevent-host-death family protein
MPKIRPVSDLRNHFTIISQIVHEQNEPVFLTKNGVGDMVVMSINHYEKLIARQELYSKLEEAEEQIRSGARGKTATEVMETMKEKHFG